MIGHIKGQIVAKNQGVVIVDVNGIGYEVELPGYVEACLRDKAVGDVVELYTLFHHAEKQPRPQVFGFRSLVERDFFQELIRVKGIGPSRAADIFTQPVGKMGRAIADGDIDALRRMKGVTPALAPKIVAELQKRAARYALLHDDLEAPAARTLEDEKKEVLAALVGQLGHSRSEGQALIDAALRRNLRIKTAEELFDEIYKGQKE